MVNSGAIRETQSVSIDVSVAGGDSLLFGILNRMVRC